MWDDCDCVLLAANERQSSVQLVTRVEVKRTEEKEEGNSARDRWPDTKAIR